MIRLLSVQDRFYTVTDENPSGDMARCTLLADGTDEPLPLTGEGVADMTDSTSIAPGSVAITPAGDVAIMANNREWGEWM